MYGWLDDFLTTYFCRFRKLQSGEYNPLSRDKYFHKHCSPSLTCKRGVKKIYSWSLILGISRTTLVTLDTDVGRFFRRVFRPTHNWRFPLSVPSLTLGVPRDLLLHLRLGPRYRPSISNLFLYDDTNQEKKFPFGSLLTSTTNLVSSTTK